MKRSLAAVVACSLWACSKGPGSSVSPEPVASASSSSSASPGAVSLASAAPSASSAPRTLRPPPPEASREERENAALALLAGKASAADLPLVDVDPGETFSPDLRRAMQAGPRARIRRPAMELKGFSDGEIKRLVEASEGSLMRCYRFGLADNPNLAGRVVVQVEVKAASEARLVKNGGSDLPDSRVVQCVLSVFRKIAFPGSIDASATIPVVFSPD